LHELISLTLVDAYNINYKTTGRGFAIVQNLFQFEKLLIVYILIALHGSLLMLEERQFLLSETVLRVLYATKYIYFGDLKY